MWNGSFSPSFRKGKTTTEARFVADDDRTEDDLSDDDAEVTGSIFVTFPNGEEYEFPNEEYGDYLDFEQTGFDMSWVNENLDINYVGDWGWPWGRTEQTGWASGK